MREEVVQDVNMCPRCLCWWQCQCGGLRAWWALLVCCWACSPGSHVFAVVLEPLQSMGSALLLVPAFGVVPLVCSLVSI